MQGSTREVKDGSNCIHASLFNLIVYVHESRRLSYFNDLVNNLSKQFPCRIIFIQADIESEADSLRVTPSSKAVGTGDLCVMCEQIKIEVSNKQLNRVPFLILPYLIPDMPLYFLWAQDPTKDKDILPTLFRYGSRLIFDTDCNGQLSKMKERLLKLSRECPQINLIDMNWLLLSGWRRIFSQVFDSQAAQERLSMTGGIQISYNSKQADWLHHPDIQAHYLATWVANRMNWQFVRQEDTQHLIYRNRGGEFTIALKGESHDEYPSGAVLGAEITCPEDHFFFIFPSPNSAKVTVHISTSNTCELPFNLPLPTLKRDFPYVRELLFAPVSPHYKEL